MVATVLKLTDQNKQKLEELSRRTGKSADELANEAIERLASAPGPQTAEPEWKAAWRKAAGMWKDRDDIPALMAQLRHEWDRTDPPG